MSIAQRRVGVIPIDDRLGLRGIGHACQTCRLIEDGNAFGRRLSQITVQEQEPFSLVDRSIVPPIKRLQSLPEERHVAFLIPALALGVGLLLFLRKAIETLRGAEQLRVGHITIPEIGAGRRGAFFRQFIEGRDRFAVAAARRIGSNPGIEFSFAFCAQADEIDPARAVDLAAQVLFVVVETGEARFILHARVRTFGRGFLDRVDPVVQQCDECRIGPLERVLHFAEPRVAIGRSRIACSHNEIAVIETGSTHLEMMLGTVRDIVCRIFGRGPIRRDIRAIE